MLPQPLFLYRPVMDNDIRRNKSVPGYSGQRATEFDSFFDWKNVHCLCSRYNKRIVSNIIMNSKIKDELSNALVDLFPKERCMY